MRVKIIFLFLAFSVANMAKAQSVFENWPALKDVHEVLSATFHPAEEGNLEPIKSRYDELIKKSALLMKSEIPPSVTSPEMVATVERLYLKSHALQKMMFQKAADAELWKQLSEVHDTFHEIVGLCKHNR